jgi:TRAP-type C4-dicarboxylate transport system permease large subunit
MRRVSPCRYSSIGASGLAAFSRLPSTADCSPAWCCFIIASAGSFAWTLTAANLPAALIQVLHLAGDSPTLFLIGSLILLITVGSLLEGLPVLIILGPLLLPIATQLGIDSIHYAMVILLAMGIGIFIPPIGICFYISYAVSEAHAGKRTKPL